MSESEKKLSYRNFIIPLVLILVLVAFFYSGLGRYLTFETLKEETRASSKSGCAQTAHSPSSPTCSHTRR